MKPKTLIRCFGALILVATLHGWTNAQTATVIPLEGLDPVALVQGKEVQGDTKFVVTRGQFQYLFANAENKATFEKDPARYEIQLDGHCARMGSPTTGNPDLYTVHNGRIYIFGSEDCQKAFKAAPEKYLEAPAPAKAPPSAAMVKRGQELIAKAAEAIGGSKLDQLASYQRKDLRGAEGSNTLLVSFPSSVRLETVRPTFSFVSVVTPADSFSVFRNAANAMPEANRTAIYKELNHDLLILLRARTQPDFKAAANGKAEAGVEYVDVELPGFATTLGIDPVSGRVLSQAYHGRGPGGVLGWIAINYSDFRTVDGLSLPFKLAATFDGQPLPTLSGTVEAITLNGQIDASSFKRPKS